MLGACLEQSLVLAKENLTDQCLVYASIARIPDL